MPLNLINIKSFSIGITLLLLLYLVLVFIISPEILLYPDALRHFWISEGITENPLLILDQWGKPLFTLLAHPFTYLGLKGMVVFNLLLTVLLIYCLYHIIIIKLIKPVWLAPVGVAILIFSPEFFQVVFSGLTEVLFATGLTMAIYSILKGRFKLAAFITGLLLFSRPEALLISICAGAFLIVRKEFKALLFLPIPILLFGLIGWIISGDLLWYFTNSPYDAHGSAYGSGTAFHFIRYFPGTLGVMLALLFGAGAIISIKDLKHPFHNDTLFWWMLIIAPATGVLLVHSFIWWKGIYGSAGLMRVIITVIPLYVLLAVRALHFLNDKFHPMASILIALLAIGWQAKQSWSIYPLPIENGLREELVKTAGTDLAPVFDRYDTIYAMEPFLLHHVGQNPISNTHIQAYNHVKSDRTQLRTTPNRAFVWDSHFGPQEGQLPLHSLLDHPQLRLTGAWSTDSAIIAFERFFEIYLFEPGPNTGAEIILEGEYDNSGSKHMLFYFSGGILSSGRKLIHVTARMNYGGNDFPEDLKFHFQASSKQETFNRVWPEDPEKIPVSERKDITFHFILPERFTEEHAVIKLSISSPKNHEGLSIEDPTLNVYPVHSD